MMLRVGLYFMHLLLWVGAVIFIPCPHDTKQKKAEFWSAFFVLYQLYAYLATSS
jgi:hypothetical protein